MDNKEPTIPTVKEKRLAFAEKHIYIYTFKKVLQNLEGILLKKVLQKVEGTLLHLRTFKMPILDLIIFRVISEIFFKYFVNSYR